METIRENLFYRDLPKWTDDISAIHDILDNLDPTNREFPFPCTECFGYCANSLLRYLKYTVEDTLMTLDGLSLSQFASRRWISL
jgi:hypothetical protein